MAQQTLAQTGKAGDVVAGGNIPGGEAVGDTKLLSVDEQKAIMPKSEKPIVRPRTLVQPAPQQTEGEFYVGDVAYVELDENGTPTGTASTVTQPGTPQAPVVLVGPVDPDAVSTPSGAPLTNHMNPAPDHFDPGFMERNPPGGTPRYPGTEQEQWAAIRSAQGDTGLATASKTTTPPPPPKPPSSSSTTPPAHSST